jgi:hypothetical protein
VHLVRPDERPQACSGAVGRADGLDRRRANRRAARAGRIRDHAEVSRGRRVAAQPGTSKPLNAWPKMGRRFVNEPRWSPRQTGLARLKAGCRARRRTLPARRRLRRCEIGGGAAPRGPESRPRGAPGRARQIARRCSRRPRRRRRGAGPRAAQSGATAGQRSALVDYRPRPGDHVCPRPVNRVRIPQIWGKGLAEWLAWGARNKNESPCRKEPSGVVPRE